MTGSAGRERIAGLVLAAGPSTRMGQVQKLLLPFGESTVVRAVVEAARDGGLDPVLAVVGHRAEEVSRALEGSGAELVENLAYRRGVGGSIAAGVRVLNMERDVVAVAVLMGDEPGIRSDVVRRAVAAWGERQPRALRAVYSDRPGHPVVLSRATFRALSRLRGDEGAAGSVFADEEVEELRLDFSAPVDVDTPAGYRRAVTERR